MKKKLVGFITILTFCLPLTACNPWYYDPWDYCYDCYEYAQFLVPDDFPTIQSAIDYALPGDQVFVRRGVYAPSTNGEFFPIYTKDGVDLVGEDPLETILDAENTDYVLDLYYYDTGIIANLTVTGGLAPGGAGIFVDNSRGQMQNLYVLGNRAEVEGSGIFVLNSNGFLIQNTIVANNVRRFADGDSPAQVEIEGSFLNFYNNVVSLGDSDGLSVHEGSDGDYQNNIFYENGSGGFGVGFADLNPFSASYIEYNLFFGNEENDFFIDGALHTAAEANGLTPNINYNFNANPLFTDPGLDNYTLQPGSPAINAGNPDPFFNNPDGSRNDIGAFGGPGANGIL